MEIRSVKFRCAALEPHQIPKEWFPHVAFAGRSNVGKSSLINWLLRRKVARVAKAPGRTRSLNFFLINGRFYLVDLPGYGFARAPEKVKRLWGEAIQRYLSSEPRLAGVVALVDSKIGMTELDRSLQLFLDSCHVPTVVVLTKADKLSKGALARRREEIQRELGLPLPPLAVSTRSGQGRGQLMALLEDLLEKWKNKQVQEGDEDGQEEERL